MKEGLTPEEVNVHAIDFVSAGVDTVRISLISHITANKVSEFK